MTGNRSRPRRKPKSVPVELSIHDLPDWVLRRPTQAFHPTDQGRTGELRRDWHEWSSARRAYLADLPVRFTRIELEAETKRRWPVVDRIKPPGSVDRRPGGAR